MNISIDTLFALLGIVCLAVAFLGGTSRLPNLQWQWLGFAFFGAILFL